MQRDIQVSRCLISMDIREKQIRRNKGILFHTYHIAKELKILTVSNIGKDEGKWEFLTTADVGEI